MSVRYVSLSFYPIDFKPWHSDPYVCRIISVNSQNFPLFFHIYSGFSASLSANLANDVHVGAYVCAISL